MITPPIHNTDCHYQHCGTAFMLKMLTKGYAFRQLENSIICWFKRKKGKLIFTDLNHSTMEVHGPHQKINFTLTMF